MTLHASGAFDEEIQCPHCDAVYCLAGVNPHPAPVVCKKCGRLMYDGRRFLRPAADVKSEK